MRLVIEFQPEYISIPIAYNQIIQAIIYNSLSPELSNFLHNKGYELEKRTFKLFTYSNLLGQYKINSTSGKKFICFNNGFKLIVSSPIEQFIRELGTTLAKNKYIEFYHQKAYIKNIRLQNAPKVEQGQEIEMLSPIVVYSRLNDNDGNTYRYYFNPKEKKFNELVTSNIIKKYKVFYDIDIDGIIALKPKKINERNIMFKNTFITGYMGIYEIAGTPELINFACECGLGSKNSQGAGLFGIVKKG